MKGELFKRSAMAMLFALTLLVAYPQSASHIRFMGIPINGSVSNFNAQLEKKGFKKTVDHYTGYFNKRKAWVGANVENGILYGVHVSFVDLHPDLGGTTIINQYVMWELEDQYNIEFVEKESSDPYIHYLYYAVNEVGFFMTTIQEVHEHEYGIDVDIIDIANARKAGVFGD